MGGDVIEEKAIIRAQYLDLVYSQSGTLYDLILHPPCPTLDPSIPSTEPPFNGLLGSVQTQSVVKSPKNQNQPANQIVTNPKNTSPHVSSTKVNAIKYL